MAEKKSLKVEEEKHEVIVDTKDTVQQNDDELTERINRLYGVSGPIEKETKQYDPKELEETRKKLIILLMIIIVGGFIVVVLLINPFDWGKNNTTVPKENETENSTETKNEIPIGEIDLSNSKVLELNNTVNFSVGDYYSVDLFPLYTNDILDTNTIPNDIKLYLLKRNNNFNSILVESGIQEYIETCNTSGLVIEKNKLDSLIKSILGPNTTIEYKDINYSYYSNLTGTKNLTMTFINDQYLLKCNNYTTNTDLTKLTQHKLVKAVKTENAIEIYQNIVFINPSGVFKEPSFTTLITNEQSVNLEDYVVKGNMYKYTFTENEDNYYLSKIELVKETD